MKRDNGHDDDDDDDDHGVGGDIYDDYYHNLSYGTNLHGFGWAKKKNFHKIHNFKIFNSYLIEWEDWVLYITIQPKKTLFNLVFVFGCPLSNEKSVN